MLSPRSLLAALLLAGSGVVAVGAPALACPASPATTTQQDVKQADDVFTGQVTDRAKDGDTVTYAVATDQVYKGAVSGAEVDVSTPVSTRACGLRLENGTDYVFFATRNGADLQVLQREGTAPATADRVAKVERILGDGHAAVPPEPVEATFDTVASEPTELRRLAAPGVALVIVGVLGLLLVAGLGRRRSA